MGVANNEVGDHGPKINSKTKADIVKKTKQKKRVLANNEHTCVLLSSDAQIEAIQT